jgi:hypothetical protein
MTVSSIEAREVSIAGHQLRCQVCDFTRFFRREARLSTGASAFGQDWTNSKAECMVCEQCGFVHWFVRTHAVAASAEDPRANALGVLSVPLVAPTAQGVEEQRDDHAHGITRICTPAATSLPGRCGERACRVRTTGGRGRRP